MGLAGLMILALLAALAVFDAVNTPDEPVTPQFSEPVPVRKRELVQALTPAASTCRSTRRSTCRSTRGRPGAGGAGSDRCTA